MSGKKKILMALLLVLVFASTVGGILWHGHHYTMVDFSFYPKDATELDLRGRDISIAHYEKLLLRLPGCEVLWDVPFQDTKISSDVRELTLTHLLAGDVDRMDYFYDLERVWAEQCTDYANLLLLQDRRPEVDVVYHVGLGGQTYPRTSEEIKLRGITEEEIPLLRCLPQLKSVVFEGGTDAQTALQLQEYCHNNGLGFFLSFGGGILSEDTVDVKITSLSEAEMGLLQCLQKMTRLHLVKPSVSAESLLAWQQQNPAVAVSWEREVYGKLCSSSDREIDLSGANVTDMAQVVQEMAYFPNVETVFLGQCGIDNESLAVYRDQYRDQFKLVWQVQCGSLTPRTDDTTFMPTRENVFYFNDEEAYNLRYCEDMVCIDLGHMSIHNIDFVQYMPKLQYLILAHTQLAYIEPIQYCKNLKFLELDWSPIKDLSPLVGCTALEDLNLGNTYADFAPIGQMTWLKNLWMIGCSRSAAYTMTQTLTNTKVQASGSATVAAGWRNLENYYAMRDVLGMGYMSW